MTVKDKFLELLITYENVILTILLVLITIILALVNIQPDTFKVASFKKETIISILSSIIASFIFFLLYELISSIRKSKVKLFEDFGLKNIFHQRLDAQYLYAESIKNSKERIWAIGMTNNKFITQHSDLLNERLRKSKNLTVKIIFWNCNSTLGNHKLHKQICCIQKAIEEKSLNQLESANCEDTASTIDNRVKSLGEKIDNAFHSRVEIGFLSIPTSFSCLITDKDTYFFPFLAHSSSHETPMLHCESNKNLGESISKHFEVLFEKNSFIYESNSLQDYLTK